MIKTELLGQIVKKQDEIIKHFKSAYYHNGLQFKWGNFFYTRKVKKVEKELSDLNKQLEECEDENPAFGQAWICPRCHKVHNWMVQSCDCSPNVITASTTTVRDESPIKENIKCDVCGYHPAVIIATPVGTFCREHARYI